MPLGLASGLSLFAPNLNLARDPRWGRAQETPGEDPLVAGEYSMAFIRGVQSCHQGTGPCQALAVAKHFADYDLEGNRGTTDRGSFDATVPARDQVEYYWPAWEATARVAN